MPIHFVFDRGDDVPEIDTSLRYDIGKFIILSGICPDYKDAKRIIPSSILPDALDESENPILDMAADLRQKTGGCVFIPLDKDAARRAVIPKQHYQYI